MNTQIIKGMPKHAKAPAQEPHAPRGNSVLHLAPFIVFMYSFMIFPPEARLQMAGVVIPIYRLVLIASVPFIVARVGTKKVGFSPVDLFILLYVVVIFTSFASLYDASYALKTSSGLLIDNGIAYMLARASLTSFHDLRRVILLTLPGVIFDAAVMTIESISNRLIIRPMFAQIFGSMSQYVGGEAIGALNYQRDMRLGLGRGYATFSHPILAGCILSSLMAMIYFSRIHMKFRVVGVAACGALFFSLSSAAVMMMAIVVATAMFDRYRGFFPFITWPRIFLALILALVMVQVVSEGGVIKVLLRYTFNPQSGYYRLFVWEYGWKTIMKSPWVGIGYAEYDRPRWMSNSIDTNYIFLGVRNGLLAPIALLGASITAMLFLGRRYLTANRLDRELLIGVSCAIFVLMFAGITVAFFGEIVPWYMAVIGIGASLAANRAGRDGQGEL